MKYKLVEKKFFPELNRELWQIEAVADFGNVKKGERGGWIEKEENLSQNDSAWVYGSARVYGYAQVCDNAKVWGSAEVCGSAWVYGSARVCDNAKVYDNAKVWGSAEVCGSARVYGYAQVCDNARVYGYALVGGNAWVYGYALVGDSKEILVLGKLGDHCRFITCTPNKSHKMQIDCGCFLGGIDAFEKAVRKKYGDDPNSDYMLIMPLLRKKEAEWAKGKE